MQRLSQLVLLFSQYFLIPAFLLILYRLLPGMIFIPFIIYTLCAVNLGLGITKYFNQILKLTGYIQKLSFSGFIGLTSFSLIILTWGQFGGKIDSILLISIYSAISLISIYYINKSKGLYNFKTGFSNLNGLDLINYTGLTLFIGLCILTVLNYYYFEYDNFSYWVTDSKIIYLTKYLRTTPDIINSVNYTSFYPLQSVFLFELFNDLKEQYAAFVTILYTAFSSFFVYSLCKSGQNTARFLTGTTLIIILTTFVYNEHLMFTSYAETFVSATILFFTYTLLQPITANQIPKKLLLVIILAFILFFTKYLNFYYSLVLTIIWVLIDSKAIFFYLKNIHIKKKSYSLLYILAYLSLPILLLVSYNHFFTKIWVNDLNSSLTSITAPFSNTALSYYNNTTTLVHYTTTLLSIILEKFNWLSIIYLFVLSFPFFNNNKLTKQQLFLTLICLLIPGINIFAYLIYPRDLLNMSLIRYLTPILFCIPLLIQYNDIHLRKSIKNIHLSLITSIMLLVFFIIFTARIPIDFSFHTGAYKDSSNMKTFNELAQIIKSEHLKSDDKILVVNNHSGNSLDEKGDKKGYITNIDPVSRKLSYFLFENNSSGAYIIKLDDFDKFIVDNKISKVVFIFEKSHNPTWLDKFDIKDIKAEEYIFSLAEVVLENNKTVTFKFIDEIRFEEL